MPEPRSNPPPTDPTAIGLREPNPYAATSIDEGFAESDARPKEGSFDEDVVGTPGMFIGTVGMTTSAGATFGILLILLMAAMTVLTSGRSGIGPEFFMFVPFALPIACLVGGIVAALTGSLVTAVMLAVTTSLRYPNGRWRVDAMRVMHWTTGALAGWLSGFSMSGFEPFGLLLGVIPAIFGGIFNAIVGERKIRRALRRQTELETRSTLSHAFPLGEASRTSKLE